MDAKDGKGTEGIGSVGNGGGGASGISSSNSGGGGKGDYNDVPVLSPKMSEALTKLNKSKLTKSGKTRSQIGKASKTKGKTGERWFTDKLSIATNLNFIRVPNSGAFVGKANRDRLINLSKTQGFITLGDIIQPDDLKYRFIFEVKNYADLDFHNILNPGGCSKINGWVEENLYDVESALICRQPNVVGLLLVKITRKGTWVIGNAGNIIGTIGLSIIPSPFMYFQHDVNPLLREKAKYNDTFFMCDFESWLRLNQRNVFEVTSPSQED